MEMTMTITVPVEVSREALAEWVHGMLNMPSNETLAAELEHQDDMWLLDNLEDEVFVTWGEVDTDTHRVACVVAVGLMDAEKRLRREISLRLIAKLGVEHQSAKVVEELAECVDAFVQFRQGRKDWADLAKEVADVLTVVEHVAHIVALDGRVDAEKFKGVVRLGVDRNWDDLSHMVGDYEDLEA